MKRENDWEALAKIVWYMYLMLEKVSVLCILYSILQIDFFDLES